MKSRPFLTFAVGMIAGMGLAAIRQPTADALGGFDRKLSRNFDRIPLGMTQAEAEKLIGTPGTVSPEFRLGQPGGFEIEYRAAALSGATKFVFWQNGIDWVYCLALDEEGKVLYKAKGST